MRHHRFLRTEGVAVPRPEAPRSFFYPSMPGGEPSSGNTQESTALEEPRSPCVTPSSRSPVLPALRGEDEHIQWTGVGGA